MEEPIVYMKVPNEQGEYQDTNGNKFDILTCHHTESKEQVQIGTETKEIDGELIEIPIYKTQIVINKGWDKFNSLAEAVRAYNLTEIEK